MLDGVEWDGGESTYTLIKSHTEKGRSRGRRRVSRFCIPIPPLFYFPIPFTFEILPFSFPFPFFTTHCFIQRYQSIHFWDHHTCNPLLSLIITRLLHLWNNHIPILIVFFLSTSHHPFDMAHPDSEVYTATYSGIQVFEMTINDLSMMRRRSDSYLNATQILKLGGLEKGKRTKILEREILPSIHEKIQGGYGKYQGTW